MHKQYQLQPRPVSDGPSFDGFLTDAKTEGSTDYEGAHAETRGSDAPQRPCPENELGSENQAIALPALSQAFLDKLLRIRLLKTDAVRMFLEKHSDHVPGYAGADDIGSALIADGLLTQYQFDRVLAGTTHGLVLGNHRVLDRLGAGGMGVVFRAEHLFMKRQVAIKVLRVDENVSPSLLARFYSEMQVLAELHHPNIVTAFDSGYVESPQPDQPSLLYLAMELVEGGDLEQHVLSFGPVEIGKACGWVSQAACGLQEAHDHNLVHRDIKPSNLLLSNTNKVKIVDFGLVQQFDQRQTSLGALLGTIDFMPPEQSQDSSSVGTAADIYGLGATLFWLLTGQPPYPQARSLSQAIANLQESPPRLLRSLRPDAPVPLESFIQTMLDRDPTRRPTLPLTVSRILSAFA